MSARRFWMEERNINYYDNDKYFTCETVDNGDVTMQHVYSGNIKVKTCYYTKEKPIRYHRLDGPALTTY